MGYKRVAVALGVGYVLGAKAGEKRYEQLKDTWERLSETLGESPLVHMLGDAGKRVASRGFDAVKERASGRPDEEDEDRDRLEQPRRLRSAPQPEAEEEEEPEEPEEPDEADQPEGETEDDLRADEEKPEDSDDQGPDEPEERPNRRPEARRRKQRSA